MDELHVRHYRPGDEESIVALLETTFGRWPNFYLDCEPIDHWKWKYLDNPFKVNSTIIGEFAGEIVACRHDQPIRLKIGDETLFCNLGSDLAVHPDHRRKGYSHSLSMLSRESKERYGYDFSYFVSSNPMWVQRLEKRERATNFPHQILNYVRIFDIDLQLEKMPVDGPLVKKYGYLSIEVLNRIRNTFSEKISYPRKDIEILKEFDEDYQRFWDELKAQYDFIVDRGSSYMNWRYLDPRAGNFIVLKAEDEEFHGFIVLFINQIIEDYPIGYIVDMLTSRSDIHTAHQLVEYAVDYFTKQGVNIINCLAVKNQHYVKALQMNGFVSSMIELKIFHGRSGLRSNDEILINKLRTSRNDRVHFMYGDIDSLPSALPNY
jgi:GNAT superfamily N-acetyltransferase